MSDFKINKQTTLFSPINSTNNIDGFRLNRILVRTNEYNINSNQDDFAIFKLQESLPEPYVIFQSNGNGIYWGAQQDIYLTLEEPSYTPPSYPLVITSLTGYVKCTGNVYVNLRNSSDNSIIGTSNTITSPNEPGGTSFPITFIFNNTIVPANTDIIVEYVCSVPGDWFGSGAFTYSFIGTIYGYLYQPNS